MRKGATPFALRLPVAIPSAPSASGIERTRRPLSRSRSDRPWSSDSRRTRFQVFFAPAVSPSAPPASRAPPTGAKCRPCGRRLVRHSTSPTSRKTRSFSVRVFPGTRATLDAGTGSVTGLRTPQSAAVTRNPFVSVPAAQLSANGYVRQGSTENTYFAPDAAVLLSDEFLRDHCFRLRQGEGRREGLIGLGFEPVRGRNKPDIAGTLWIDR